MIAITENRLGKVIVNVYAKFGKLIRTELVLIELSINSYELRLDVSPS